MRDMKTKPIHPANIMPNMTEAEYAELKADIETNGYRKGEPIELLDGKVIDGRQRDRACAELGVTPTYKDITLPKDVGPFTYVLSKNRRRNMTPSQWAGVLARARGPVEAEALKRKEQHGKGGAKATDTATATTKPEGRTSAILAQSGLAGQNTVQYAIAVDKADPKLLDRVIAGEISAPAANRVVKKEADLVEDKATGKVTVVPRMKAAETKKKGIALDMRPGGFLAAVATVEDAMRAVVMLRKNKKLGAAEKEEAIRKLEWIAEEAVTTRLSIEGGKEA